MKTYIANSVWLYGVEDRFRASNGNCQFTIVVRAKNQKRVAELIGGNCSLHHLQKFCGIRLASDAHANIPNRDNVIYYYVAHLDNKWLAYLPNLGC